MELLYFNIFELRSFVCLKNFPWINTFAVCLKASIAEQRLPDLRYVCEIDFSKNCPTPMAK